MSTDHYLLLFDLALFALAVVFLGKLMTQWIAQGRTSKRCGPLRWVRWWLQGGCISYIATAPSCDCSCWSSGLARDTLMSADRYLLKQVKIGSEAGKGR